MYYDRYLASVNLECVSLIAYQKVRLLLQTTSCTTRIDVHCHTCIMTVIWLVSIWNVWASLQIKRSAFCCRQHLVQHDRSHCHISIRNVIWLVSHLSVSASTHITRSTLLPQTASLCNMIDTHCHTSIMNSLECVSLITFRQVHLFAAHSFLVQHDRYTLPYIHYELSWVCQPHHISPGPPFAAHSFLVQNDRYALPYIHYELSWVCQPHHISPGPPFCRTQLPCATW